jgi:hypothetical protein
MSNEQLRALLEELANGLEAELKARYEHNGEVHPAQKGRYDRDMAPVIRAREFLSQSSPAAMENLTHD